MKFSDGYGNSVRFVLRKGRQMSLFGGGGAGGGGGDGDDKAAGPKRVKVLRSKSGKITQVKVKAHVSRSKSGKITQVKGHERNVMANTKSSESFRKLGPGPTRPELKPAEHKRLARQADGAVQAIAYEHHWARKEANHDAKDRYGTALSHLKALQEMAHRSPHAADAYSRGKVHAALLASHVGYPMEGHNRQHPVTHDDLKRAAKHYTDKSLKLDDEHELHAGGGHAMADHHKSKINAHTLHGKELQGWVDDQEWHGRKPLVRTPTGADHWDRKAAQSRSDLRTWYPELKKNEGVVQHPRQPGRFVSGEHGGPKLYANKTQAKKTAERMRGKVVQSQYGRGWLVQVQPPMKHHASGQDDRVHEAQMHKIEVMANHARAKAISHNERSEYLLKLGYMLGMSNPQSSEWDVQHAYEVVTGKPLFPKAEPKGDHHAVGTVVKSTDSKQRKKWVVSGVDFDRETGDPVYNLHATSGAYRGSNWTDVKHHEITATGDELEFTGKEAHKRRNAHNMHVMMRDSMKKSGEMRNERLKKQLGGQKRNADTMQSRQLAGHVAVLERRADRLNHPQMMGERNSAAAKAHLEDMHNYYASYLEEHPHATKEHKKMGEAALQRARDIHETIQGAPTTREQFLSNQREHRERVIRQEIAKSQKTAGKERRYGQGLTDQELAHDKSPQADAERARRAAERGDKAGKVLPFKPLKKGSISSLLRLTGIKLGLRKAMPPNGQNGAQNGKQWQKKDPGAQQQMDQPDHIGATVDFRHPETGDTHSGKIMGHGDHGVTIEDQHGERHKVHHGHYLHPGEDDGDADTDTDGDGDAAQGAPSTRDDAPDLGDEGDLKEQVEAIVEDKIKAMGIADPATTEDQEGMEGKKPSPDTDTDTDADTDADTDTDGDGVPDKDDSKPTSDKDESVAEMKKGRAFGTMPVFERGEPTRIPGVYKVQMRKAVADAAIRHVDDGITMTPTLLTPPELVPGTMLKGLDGDVMKAVFKIGPYFCEFKKASRKPPILSISGTGMAVPYHMVVRSWDDAMIKGQRATEAFAAGDPPPDEGVYRHIGDRVEVKWPGRHR